MTLMSRSRIFFGRIWASFEFAPSRTTALGAADADHGNGPDLGGSVAREWYAGGVGVIADVPDSAAAVAVQQGQTGKAYTT
jgi:hypothetical protein